MNKPLKGQIFNEDGSISPMPEVEAALYTELFGIKEELDNLEVEKAVLNRRFEAVDEKLSLYYIDQNREKPLGVITHGEDNE